MADRRPKGHWPAGKRRNPPPPARLLTRLRKGDLNTLAQAAGIAPRTLRRWRDGVDHPSPELAARVLQARK